MDEEESNDFPGDSFENYYFRSRLRSPTSRTSNISSSYFKSNPVVLLIYIKDENINKTSPQNDQNYLRPFRKIYEMKGYTVLLVTPTADRLTAQNIEEVVTSLLESLEKRQLDKNPLILHVLGHDAIPFHNALCHRVHDEREIGNYYDIRGCILDSCPMQKSRILELIKNRASFIYDFYILLVCLVRTFFPEFFGGARNVDDYQDFCTHPGKWHELFLYSTSDHVVPHTDVEKAISHRHAAFGMVDQKCWDDTQHARHLYAHQEEYSQLCLDFVDMCLKKIS
ncbi:transmembrane protein 53-A-like [Physella acuta]|uniref:transmembrane protein 53-A-like n=1 Tax=Physella acuta TaxID=109671 RepID=UPI0027DB706C|nr:transmembrane protein 53-A-like [Physella acuta]